MKIIEITHALSSGGGERLVVDLCNRFAETAGIEVVLLISKDLSIPGNSHYLPDLSKKVTLIELKEKGRFSFSSLIKYYYILKHENADIVHSHGGFISLLIPSLLLKRAKYFVTMHTLPSRWAYTNWRKKLSAFLFNRNVMPITISDVCHKDYINFYGRDNDVVVVNGREPLRTTELAKDVRKYINGLKSSTDTPIFIHVARAHPVKNHLRLFSTFKRLAKEGIDFELIVLGTGYEVYDKELYNNLHIHLVGECRNVGDYMACADFFVLTSDNEGLPLTLLEAMSMGVIPICTPAGGIKDVIRNGENGYMPIEIDDELYYNSVKKALQERGIISSDRIIEDYQKQYSMKVCAENYLKVFKR